MSAPTFHRVQFLDGGRARTVILRDLSHSADAAVVAGVEVKRNGDEVRPAGHDERLRVIDVDLIADIRPMRWDLHYGELTL